MAKAARPSTTQNERSNMQVVFFPEELHARAPSAVGVLCYAPTNEWVTLFDVVDMVRTGENVTIRPASQKEVERAEQLVVLYEIGKELSQCIGKLLDQEAPEVVDQHRAHLAEAISSVKMPFPDLVQEEVALEAGAAPAETGQTAPVNPLEALPLLYAALRCAHIDGEKEAFVKLDRQIQAILFGSAAADVAVERARSAAE